MWLGLNFTNCYLFLAVHDYNREAKSYVSHNYTIPHFEDWILYYIHSNVDIALGFMYIVEYTKCSDEIESIFTQKNLKKHPTTEMLQFVPPVQILISFFFASIYPWSLGPEYFYVYIAFELS